MTVQFQEDPVTLAGLFSPLIGRPYKTPAHFMLAVIVKGIDNEVPTDNIRDWLIRYGDRTAQRTGGGAAMDQHGFNEDEEAPANGASVKRASSRVPNLRNRETWLELLREAEEWRDSSLLTGARAAERLYAVMMLPLPTEANLNIASRVNLRFTYLAFLMHLLSVENPLTSGHANQEVLAAKLGTSVRTQTNNVGWLRDMGLITKLSRAHRIGLYRVTAVSEDRKAELGRLDQLQASMRAFALGEPEPIVNLLNSALHPTWTYGALTHQHLFLLIIRVAGLDPVDFGYRDRLASTLRNDLVRAGLLLKEGSGRSVRHRMIPLDELAPALDRLADDPAFGKKAPEDAEQISARKQHEAAMAIRSEQAAERKSVLVKQEKQRQFVQHLVDDLLAQHRIPPVPTQAEAYLKRKMVKSRPRRSGNERVGVANYTFDPDPEDVIEEMERRKERLVKWRSRMRGAMSEYSFESEAERKVGDQIAGWLSYRLRKKGYGAGWVERNVRYIVHGTPLSD